MQKYKLILRTFFLYSGSYQAQDFPSLNSTEEELTVTFTSDAAAEDFGFHATWQTFPKTEKIDGKNVIVFVLYPELADCFFFTVNNQNIILFRRPLAQMFLFSFLALFEPAFALEEMFR